MTDDKQQTLAAKPHRYDLDFPIMCCLHELAIGELVKRFGNLETTIIRECNIREFVHLDLMRMVYSTMVQQTAPGTKLYFYEVLCVQV